MTILILFITATITFALRIASHTCVETFTVFFLTLRFFAVANPLLRGMFASVFSNCSSILDKFVILWNIWAITAAALFCAHFTWREALTVQLQAASFFTDTPVFLFLSRSSEALISTTNRLFFFTGFYFLILVLLDG